VSLNSSDDIKKQLETILAGEEYQAYNKQHENFLMQWVEKIINWLIEFLRELLPGAGVSENTYRWISYALILLFFLLLLILLGVFLRRYIRGKKGETTPLGTHKEFSMRAKDHIKTAEKYAGNGDYRQGIRYLFLALLLHLNEKEWLKARPWKTNGEYYDELLEVSPPFAERFHVLSGIFDESFYGGRSTNREDYNHFYQQVKEWMGGEQE
jgi:hypothetical protein